MIQYYATLAVITFRHDKYICNHKIVILTAIHKELCYFIQVMWLKCVHSQVLYYTHYSSCSGSERQTKWQVQEAPSFTDVNFQQPSS